MPPENLIARLAHIRRELHALAEPSGGEKRTADYLAGLLRSCKPARLLESVGGHGLVAEFAGAEPGPRIGLRADMDALAEARGARHGCGHDGHMALLCAVALSLADRPLKRGSAVLIFQPAEETGQGAAAMLADSRWPGMAPDLVFALHNLPGLPLGQVAVRDGVMCLASVGLKANLAGAASHAAHPEKGRSPAPALARLLSEMTGLAGRDDLLTLTHAHMGDPGFGTSPGEALLQATLRASGDEALDALQEKAASLINEVAEAHGLTYNMDWLEPFAAATNHPTAVEIVRKAAAQRKLSLNEPERPFRWSEDFGRFAQDMPGALLCLGAGEACPPLHAGEYEFPDDLLEIGLGLWLSVLEQAQTIRS